MLDIVFCRMKRVKQARIEHYQFVRCLSPAVSPMSMVRS
jgi:hypothetical protein